MTILSPNNRTRLEKLVELDPRWHIYSEQDEDCSSHFLPENNLEFAVWKFKDYALVIGILEGSDSIVGGKTAFMSMLLEQIARYLSDELMEPDASGDHMLHQAEYVTLHKRLTEHIFSLTPEYILDTQIAWLEAKPC